MINEKEVDFSKYCATCEHEDTPENEHPCDECLEQPSNWGSRKPTMWKEKSV